MLPRRCALTQDFEALLLVMRDAALEGDEPALAALGAKLAERLGVTAAGMDGAGAWLRLEVGAASYRMRFIAPGRFVMGSPGTARADEQPHEVVLTRGYWLGEVPVTQALWRAVTGASPSTWPGDDRPVESVSWDACVAFCAQLQAMLPALRVRLPTEAEWEYAARAGAPPLPDATPGDADPLDSVAWYHDNSGIDPLEIDDPLFAVRPAPSEGTRVVGLKEPNAWGLHDLLGNVYEWCADAATYGEPCATGMQVDPLGTEGPDRVQRGGGWNIEARYVRAAFRNATPPGERRDNLGLRLAADGVR